MTATGGPEQLAFDGMPTRLFPCTPSRLAAYLDCPRRYRMTYLDRPAPPKGPRWAHNSLGVAVHNALRQWWELPRPRRTVAAAGRLLDAAWIPDGFRDEAQASHWRDQARRWVEDYVADLDPDDEPVGLERHVATRTERLALSGRVDRIDRRGDELVVVDYKTGRRAPDEDDARASLALACYVLATRRTLRRACHRVELHHVRSGTVAGWEHSEESLGRHVTRAEATADDIVVATDTLSAGAHPDDVFPPRPGTQCGWCDFRQHCPEGQQAAPAREPWELLDTPAAGTTTAGPAPVD